jgi:hypothetical protein
MQLSRRPCEKPSDVNRHMVCCRLIQVRMSDEAAIAPLFACIVEEFPDVASGSYPQVREA